MRFTLQITIDNPTKYIKHKIMGEVARYLSKHGYSFDVGYCPNEIDTTTIDKHKIMTIQQLADVHVGHPEELGEDSTITAQRESFKWGALKVLKEVEMTISVSEEVYLESNLKKLIKQLKGEL